MRPTRRRSPTPQKTASYPAVLPSPLNGLWLEYACVIIGIRCNRSFVVCNDVLRVRRLCRARHEVCWHLFPSRRHYSSPQGIRSTAYPAPSLSRTLSTRPGTSWSLSIIDDFFSPSSLWPYDFAVTDCRTPHASRGDRDRLGQGLLDFLERAKALSRRQIDNIFRCFAIRALQLVNRSHFSGVPRTPDRQISVSRRIVLPSPCNSTHDAPCQAATIYEWLSHFLALQPRGASVPSWMLCVGCDGCRVTPALMELKPCVSKVP